MRPLTWLLTGLLMVLQYPLWIGKGGWLRVAELKQEIEAQEAVNHTLKVRNDRLQAEVDDLQYGYAAIEERARFELGMIKKNEVFFQVMEPVAHPFAKPSPGALPKSISNR